MSKRFKTQDSHRYKKLGTRWRRPVGWQSKMRKKKGGAGLKVSIGYGTPGKPLPVVVRTEADLTKDCKSGILIASTVGAKKAKMLAEKAAELNIVILNRKKVKRAKRVEKNIQKNKEKKIKEEKKKKEEEKKAEEAKKKAELDAKKTSKEKAAEAPLNPKGGK